MGTVLRKIRCPGGSHEDETPSCAVYDDGSGYCFSCNGYFKSIAEPVVELVKEQENLRDKIAYIRDLPVMDHRGCSFRYDSRGYYIVWPLEDYYKLRLWAPRPGEPKYIGAKGHKKPWYCLRAYKKVNTCIIVEGEINAISIDNAVGRDQFDILSPGGASNFFDSEMKLRASVFNNYAKLIVLVDNDKAGTEAAIKFHKLIKPYCIDIKIKLMETDCNQTLTNNGAEELKKTILDM